MISPIQIVLTVYAYYAACCTCFMNVFIFSTQRFFFAKKITDFLMPQKRERAKISRFYILIVLLSEVYPSSTAGFK